MKRDELRLELLKLTHTLGRDAPQAVDRAKILEAYVLEEEPDETQKLEVSKDISKKPVRRT